MSGSRIVESMREAVAFAQGALPTASYTVHIPATVDVKTIRHGLGLSQASFSPRFGLSLHTLWN